jgi:hypothetical protein
MWMIRHQEQRSRMALLGTHLANYQIEKHLQTLMDGYQRALGEGDTHRRDQIWQLLRPTELALSSQLRRLAADFALAKEADTRVSKLPVHVPLAARLLPRISFDMRQALALHARTIGQAVHEDSEARHKERAFHLSAELFLLQHTCHWYCRSRRVASARMWARHRTSHAQLVEAVPPRTREAYRALTG